MSILEMNHRSAIFGDIMEACSMMLRELLGLDDSYEILYVNGGGSMQFSMIPMNLMRSPHSASYVDTDLWTKYAIAEAEKFGMVQIIASSADKNYTYIPEIPAENQLLETDYVYICTNNTASGTAYRPENIPKFISVPLVADMTSNFLSECYNINDFGLVFAAAQKNLGPTGVTVVIVKKNLIMDVDERTIPRIMCYKEYVETNSTFSTPSTFAIYMILLVLQWIKRQGGIQAMAERNAYKAELLYDFIDNSSIFRNDVHKRDRSLMNVVFTTGNARLDKTFETEAEKQGLCNLAGYQSLGGLRAGIYNGVGAEAVEALVAFMKNFERKYKGESDV